MDAVSSEPNTKQIIWLVVSTLLKILFWTAVFNLFITFVFYNILINRGIMGLVHLCGSSTASSIGCGVFCGQYP